MSPTESVFRRRRYLILRVADEPVLDIGQLMRGAIQLSTEVLCSLLCPVRRRSLPLTAAELAVVVAVPSDRWVSAELVQSAAYTSLEQLNILAKRGIILANPPPKDWSDLADSEEELASAQWHDLTAVYHAHSTWNGIDGGATHSAQTRTRVAGSNSHKASRDPAPAHFVQRIDAIDRIKLSLPILQGAYFDNLMARRTTRSFDTNSPMLRGDLEAMLFAVFGTHGLKQGEGVTGIKRTSPSGGALHPVEAYLLVTKVKGLIPGLYHYESGAHALAKLEEMNEQMAREVACLFTAGQRYFAQAHALVIHVARFDRNFWKYSQHRKAYKAVLMDSAHLSQTFYLTATHLGLGAFYTAAINDVDIGQRLRLRSMVEAAIGINGIGPSSKLDEFQLSPSPFTPGTK